MIDDVDAFRQSAEILKERQTLEFKLYRLENFNINNMNKFNLNVKQNKEELIKYM